MTEGIDAHGFVVTGVDATRIAPSYGAIVDEAVAELRAAYGDRLVAVYVYGSVATGAARPPGSDLDMVAIFADDADPAPAATLAGVLSERYAATVREVAIGTGTEAGLAAGSSEAHANRCFLKHYCALVAGRDVAEGFSPCRPTPELALGFAGDVAGHVARLLERYDQGAPDFPAVAARRLLLAAAPLVSVLAGTWTTSRIEAVRLTAAHHPERAAEARELARWLAGASPTVDVRALVVSFGRWLAGPVVEAVTARR